MLDLVKGADAIPSQVKLLEAVAGWDVFERRDAVHRERKDLKSTHLADYADICKVVGHKIQVSYPVELVGLRFKHDELCGQGFRLRHDLCLR